MIGRRSTLARALLRALGAALQTTIVVSAIAFTLGITPPAAAQSRFDSARRLTWSRATRTQGIAELRAVVREDPTAWPPRFELGRARTWDRATRGEGLTLLNALAFEHPENAEVREALAEVLSWSVETRPAAVERLRHLVAAHPDRASARLRLAEILSWSLPSRGDAETIYRDVLAHDPSSTVAQVGLARLRSWSGDFRGAEELYHQAMATAPEDLTARIGLAEVETWSQRPHQALETLGDIPAEGTAPPEARRARAAALAALDRPALALAEYDEILKAYPGDEPARRGAESLRLRLRPQLTIGAYSSTEAGDPRTDKVEVQSVPLSFAWHLARDRVVEILSSLGSYRNDLGSSSRFSLGGAMRAPLGLKARISAELQGHHFAESSSKVTGAVELCWEPAERLKLRGGVSRDLLTGSRLSAVGEERGSGPDRTLYGPALADEVYLGVGVRVGHKWDLGARAAAAQIRGHALRANDRTVLSAWAGRAFGSGPVRLRAAATIFRMTHDRDLAGFPPEDLSGDGIGARAVGGYFSPLRFVNAMGRLEASWAARAAVHVFATVAVGRQETEDAQTRPHADRRTSSEALLGVSWDLNPQFGLRALVQRLDVGQAYNWTQAHCDFVWTF